MRKRAAGMLLVPAAAMALPFMAPLAASAAPSKTTYQAALDPVNDSGASGNMMVWLDGDQAKIKGHVEGVAATFKDNPYPHVQHIHGGANGQCPGMSADKNGDGIVDTVEGRPAYGKIQTTLSVKGDTSPKAGTNVKIAPSGDSYDYTRTITLNDKTMQSLKNGKAVVVVHGLDPAPLSKKAQGEKSNLVPKLPLAATAPTLCGTLTKTQMGVPNGSADTGGGSTSGLENGWLFGLGGAALAAAGGALLFRRRTAMGQR